MKKNWLLPAIISIIPLFSQAQEVEPVGIVLAASGNVIATEIDGDSRSLQRRSAIYEGDTISTGAQSRVQFRFNDNGRIALQPESSFYIEAHEFNGQEDGTENASYELVRGGLQAITGLIGHTNKEQYNVSTPLANIGLRGTHWAATYCEGTDCSGNPPGLYGGVAEGGIDVCNSAGCTAVDADTYFYTPNTGALTQTLLAPPNNIFLDSPQPDAGNEGAGDSAGGDEDTESPTADNGNQAGTPNANANQNAFNAVSNGGNGNSDSGDDSSDNDDTSSGGNGNGSGNETSAAAIAGEQISQVAEQAREVATAFDEESTPVAARALERATAFNFSEGDDTVSDFSDDELDDLGNSGNGRGQGSSNPNSNAGGNSGNGNSGNSGSGNSGNSGNGNNSGEDTSGGDTSGGDTSGGDTTSGNGNSGNSDNGNSGNSGNGNNSGEDTSGGDTSGGDTSGGDTTSGNGNSGNSGNGNSGNSGNGNNSGEDTSGGDTSGGDTTSGNGNSGNSGNGNNSGEDTSGGDTSGGDTTSGNGNSGNGNSGNSGNSGNGNSSGDDTSGGDTSGGDTTSGNGNSGNGNSGNSGNSGNGNSGQGNNDSGTVSDEVPAELTAMFGDNVQFESNLDDSDRVFSAFWGRWSGPNSNGNNLDDHFAYSPDNTTSLPTSGTLSYSLLGATAPADQTGKEGQVNAIEMLIDFTAQSIQTMSLDLSTGTSHWEMENSSAVNLGSGANINVALEGSCFDACAKRFESIPATGSSTVSLIGSQAEGALGTYELSAGSATATGAFVLESDD